MCVYAYFAINITYVVSIYIINIFKRIVLYSSIVFIAIMPFGELHGIVVISHIKSISTQSCIFVFLFDFQILFCFKSKFVML